MTTPTSWQPSTGADSVRLPAECHSPHSPDYDAAWARYWRDRQEAEDRETTDEAVIRCRAEADLFADGGQRFDHVLEVVIDTFDRHVADLGRPDGELYRGLSLDESGFYGGLEIGRMNEAWKTMADAFDDLDRERYRKAAAEFAGALADMAVGLHPATPSETGGAS